MVVEEERGEDKRGERRSENGVWKLQSHELVVSFDSTLILEL
jgi:hypothetical protein